MRLREGSNLSAWLFTTLANLCHNLHRWKRRHPAASLDGHADGGPGEGADALRGPDRQPDLEMAHGEALEALRKAVDGLPHGLKAAVLLHHYQQLSYHEIASITGCSDRAVETRLYRARQMLRQELAEFLGEGSLR
jgi:RNA polymerase sigma-70 factor (ECF subfamily)